MPLHCEILLARKNLPWASSCRHPIVSTVTTRARLSQCRKGMLSSNHASWQRKIYRQALGRFFGMVSCQDSVILVKKPSTRPA